MITGLNFIVIFIPLLVIWYSLGLFILAAVDDEDHNLLEWSKQFKFGNLSGAIMCWPIIFIIWTFKLKKER